MTKQLRDEFIGVRVTARQREILERHAQANRLSLSDVIRTTIELLADTLEESQTRSKPQPQPKKVKHIIRPRVQQPQATNDRVNATLAAKGLGSTEPKKEPVKRLRNYPGYSIKDEDDPRYQK